MTILVDADGVLENLPVEFPALLNEKYGTDVQFEQMRERGFAKSFPKLTYEQIFSAELEETLDDRGRYSRKLCHNPMAESRPFRDRNFLVTQLLRGSRSPVYAFFQQKMSDPVYCR